MNESELKKDEIYWCKWLNDWVVYCGTQKWKDETYHNFFRVGLNLFYWLDPEDVVKEEA